MRAAAAPTVVGVHTPRDVDADFLALPLDALADAALQVARDAGATYAAVRIQQVRETTVRVRDRAVEGSSDVTDAGLSVRVVLDGVWGFAAHSRLDVTTAARTAALAVRSATVARPLVLRPVRLAPVEVQQGTWVSSYALDPFDVPADEQAGLLLGWGEQVLAAGASHAEAESWCVKEQKFYADLDGSRTVQQRVRMHPGVTAVVVADDGRVDTVRSLAPPVGRGWEYLSGHVAPLVLELPGLAEAAREKLAAPSVEPGRYDLVIDPSQLWLTIHESVAHATELDRALGYEAA